MKRHAPSNPHPSIHPSFSTPSHQSYRLPRRKSYRRPAIQASNSTTSPTPSMRYKPQLKSPPRLIHFCFLSRLRFCLFLVATVVYRPFVFPSRRPRYTHNVVLPAFFFNILFSFFVPFLSALSFYLFHYENVFFLEWGFLSIIHRKRVFVDSFPFHSRGFLSLTQAKELRACLIEWPSMTFAFTLHCITHVLQIPTVPCRACMLPLLL